MSEVADFCIDVEAVKALIHWKSLFADEVAFTQAATSRPNPVSRRMSPCHTTGRLHKSPFAHSRLRFWTEGHPVTTAKPHESEQPASAEAISLVADDWIRQFIKVFEQHLLDASRDLPPDASVSESQAATARAFLATYLDSGVEFESAVELLGQVAVEWRSVDAAWSDALNQRRFALIDKDIQGSLTPAESIELAGLTRIMRHHVESETNLPLLGARAMHRKLLQVRATDESE